MLSIPIEGDGTVYLKGDVLDHQPQIAFGTPLVPPMDKINIRAPVLLESNELVGSAWGASTMADQDQAATFFTPQDNFLFALQPFPGAVQGEANWGEITFKLDGENYRLLAAAPITGGDQPRAVWVRRDVQFNSELHCETVCVGSVPLPK